MEAIHIIYKVKRGITEVPIIPKIVLKKLSLKCRKGHSNPSKTFLFLSCQMLKIARGRSIAFFFLAFLRKKLSQGKM